MARVQLGVTTLTTRTRTWSPFSTLTVSCRANLPRSRYSLGPGGARNNSPAGRTVRDRNRFAEVRDRGDSMIKAVSVLFVYRRFGRFASSLVTRSGEALNRSSAGFFVFSPDLVRSI